MLKKTVYRGCVLAAGLFLMSGWTAPAAVLAAKTTAELATEAAEMTTELAAEAAETTAELATEAAETAAEQTSEAADTTVKAEEDKGSASDKGTSENAASAEGYESIVSEDGRTIYVLTPEDYDPSQSYPSLYLMPADGFSASCYLKDGVDRKIRELMRTEEVMDMIIVLPQFGQAGGEASSSADESSVSFNLYEQLEKTIEAVEENYSAIPDPSMRGALGTETGGYLAFLLGYLDREGCLSETPLYFKAIGSQDGDFNSPDNPYAGSWPDIYDSLYGSVNTHYSSECQWLKNYYTYIDSNSDRDLSSAEGSSNDLAVLYRTDALDLHHSASSWDYSVFEYSSRGQEHYGSYSDNLDRPLNRFSLAFGMEVEAETETEYIPEDTVSQGEDRKIDLMGDWHFKAYKAYSNTAGPVDLDNIDSVLKENWNSWDIVQPAFDWWSADFASSLNGNANYAGYAWYIRSFDVPEDFDRTSLALYAGMIDEADEAFINGVRIGSTGIEKEAGNYDMTNPWDVERIYPIPDDLLQPGENTVAVRVCNSTGAGGWYSGPVRIGAVKELTEEEAKKVRFYETVLKSDVLSGTEVTYRVYLPEGYYESDQRYPVTYMLHGIGSTGKSFEIAGVPEILDEGIAEGTIPPCIVIFPDDGHPWKQSWWSGPYASMLNDELVKQVDETLRTIPDRRGRGLAGESMGGGGAFLNALKRPDLYSWVFDIYGAVNFAGISQTMMAETTTKEFLSQFRQYFISGNHDMYTFDLVHIPYDRRLDQLGVEHFFEVDNGEHSSAFYLPYVKEAFGYILESYKETEEDKTPDVAEGNTEGNTESNSEGNMAVDTADGNTESEVNPVVIENIEAGLADDGRLTVSFKASCSDYEDLLPGYISAPADTAETKGDLTVPVCLTVRRGGEILAAESCLWTLKAEENSAEAELQIEADLEDEDVHDLSELDLEVSADLSWL